AGAFCSRVPETCRELEAPATVPQTFRSLFPQLGLVFAGFVCFVILSMSDKLTEIMNWKRREIAPLMRDVTLDELHELDRTLPRPPSFAEALRREDKSLAVIAEIKRRSPSAGAIATGISAPVQAERYRAAG